MRTTVTHSYYRRQVASVLAQRLARDLAPKRLPALVEPRPEPERAGRQAAWTLPENARGSGSPGSPARRWTDADGVHIDVRGLRAAGAAGGDPRAVESIGDAHAGDRAPRPRSVLLYPRAGRARLDRGADRRAPGRSAAEARARAVKLAAGAFLAGAASRLLPASIPFRFLRRRGRVSPAGVGRAVRRCGRACRASPAASAGRSPHCIWSRSACSR